MSLLGGAGALAVALVLLATGVAHLRDKGVLRSALAAHDVLPHGLQRAVTAVLGPVELVLGAGLVAVVALGAGGASAAGTGGGASSVLATDPTRLLALVAALLTAGFTAYLLVVVRRTGGEEEIPCGCGLGTTPVGPWAVVRAALLTGLAGLAVVGGAPGWTGSDLPLGGATHLATPVWAQAVLVVAAGLTLAVATAALPAARAVPAGLTTLHGGAR